MVRSDDVGRDVNRLYWESDEPVTRLAEQIGVSRGTFYNHLRPLPARATCSTCGGRLLFRNRSSRDAREAHCGECGRDEHIGSASAGPAPAKPGKQRSADANEIGSPARRLPAAVAARFEDEAETMQLLLIAVGAAAVGLGLLFFSRRR